MAGPMAGQAVEACRVSHVEASINRLANAVGALIAASDTLDKRLAGVTRGHTPEPPQPSGIEKAARDEAPVPLAARINEISAQAEAAHRCVDSILRRLEV